MDARSHELIARLGEELASEVAGRAVSVRKAMELLPIGPAAIVDTPGIDDEGDGGGLPA